MITYERELESLAAAGVIDDSAEAPLIAIERRQLFSVWGELRAITWLGVMLLTTGLGIVLSKNLDRIGPVAVATLLALLAGGCYAFAWWKRSRESSLVDDYVLLLASLLLSADLGYVEHTFHLLGASWSRHLLLLAVVHGTVAYLFDSVTVLTLAAGAIAAYVGFDHTLAGLLGSENATKTAVRAFLLAAILLGWREIDRHLRPSSAFTQPLTHMLINVACWGALSLTFHEDTRMPGVLLAVIFSTASTIYGLRNRSEAFVLYGYVYGIVAVDIFVVTLMPGSEMLTFLYLVSSTIIAIVGLFLTHQKLSRRMA